jgi:hypothetical protein
MTSRLVIACVFVLVVWSVSGSTFEPVRAAVDQGLLPQTVRQQLRQSIDRARNETPDAFTAVDRVIASFPEMKAQSVGRPTTIGFALRRIGSDALFPMLELLVYGIPENAGYDPELWPEIQVDLIGVVGLIRDPRSLPILSAILDSGLVNEAALKETVASLAQLASDDVVRYLFSVLDDPHQPARQRRAVLWGIGFCGRMAVAERLADELQRRPEVEDAVLLLDSLKRAGIRARSSSATKQTADEQTETRRIVAEAALWSISQYDDAQVHNAAETAILGACDPETSWLISNAKKDASPGNQAALDSLEKLWHNSSTRKYCLP